MATDDSRKSDVAGASGQARDSGIRIPGESGGAGRRKGRVSSVTWLSTGFIQTKERFLVPGGSMDAVDMPVGVAVIEHPEHGLGLFDTGLTEVFYGATRKMPFRLFRQVTPMRRIRSAAQQVAGLGKNIQDVQWIVVSHFDYDHVGGLGDFPHARIVCRPEGWESVRAKKGMAAMFRRSIPDFVSDEMESRMDFVTDFPDPLPEPLGRGKDLFGDGSVLLVDLPGHAPGHIGALVRSEEADWFFVGDAVWSFAALQGSRDGFVHQMTSVSRSNAKSTRARLRLLLEDPWGKTLRILPTHCPTAWRKWGRPYRDPVHGNGDAEAGDSLQGEEILPGTKED